MRVVVYGVGAIGGTVAAALAMSGAEVVGIARGAMLDALRAEGLRFRTPELYCTVQFEVVADPADLTLRPDDAILLTMKTQDTEGALARLRAAGATDQPIFCAQNGVANEGLALRHFPNVHGVAVMMPASYVTPGEVTAEGHPRHGIFDLGRHPAGSDAADAALADALRAANIEAFVTEDVMASKHGKLLLNLNNLVAAACGGADTAALKAALRAEGEAAYRAAGIAWTEVGMDDPRRSAFLQIREVGGEKRIGSSSVQSLARGTGSLETPWLNGEIALLGRLHGVPTPANARMCRIADDLLAGAAPGSFDPAAILGEP